MVIESVSLDQNGLNGDGSLATGTFDDAFGDQPYVVSTPNGPDQVCGTPITTPIQHQTIKSGGSFNLTHTFKIGSNAAAYMHNGADATVRFDSYSATIHAQPYNFRRVYFPNTAPPTSVLITAGELQFYYKWSSTSGVMSDLSGETIHENVDAPSSPSITINGVAYYNPPAPFNWAPDFHKDSVSVTASSTDGITDSHSWGNGQAPITQCFVQKYVANSFNLTQNYKFNDPATMQTGTEQQIPGNSGPFTITDAVVVDNASPTGYSFTVTKDGSTSLLQPLP